MKIVTLFPELLGTYGDGGNGVVLRERLARRGRAVSYEAVTLGEPVPEADLYLLGGGEDGPQRQATRALRESDLVTHVANGAHLFAVCAGLQILGTHFAVAGDEVEEGLGLVDVTTARGARRAVGDVVTDVEIDGVVHQMIGFENHGGVTTRGEVPPLGTVRDGFGNGDGTDGFVSGRVIATYAHGPVLALNPWFADYLLARVLGESLAPLPSPADALYRRRLEVLGLTPRPSSLNE